MPAPSPPGIPPEERRAAGEFPAVGGPLFLLVPTVPAPLGMPTGRGSISGMDIGPVGQGPNGPLTRAAEDQGQLGVAVGDAVGREGEVPGEAGAGVSGSAAGSSKTVRTTVRMRSMARSSRWEG
jgi:hypothetical protein